MKLLYLSAILFLAFILIGCVQKREEFSNADREKIVETLDKFWNAYEQKDVKTIRTLFLDGSEISVIFPGKDDIYLGGDQLEYGLTQFFKRSYCPIVKYRILSLNNSGITAWVTQLVTLGEECQTANSERLGRLTILLVKSGGGWKIRQFHWSFSAKPDS